MKIMTFLQQVNLKTKLANAQFDRSKSESKRVKVDANANKIKYRKMLKLN